MIVPDHYYIQFDYQTLTDAGQVTARIWSTQVMATDATGALLQALISFRQELLASQTDVWGLKAEVILANDVTRQALEELLPKEEKDE